MKSNLRRLIQKTKEIEQQGGINQKRAGIPPKRQKEIYGRIEKLKNFYPNNVKAQVFLQEILCFSFWKALTLSGIRKLQAPGADQ